MHNLTFLKKFFKIRNATLFVCVLGVLGASSNAFSQTDPTFSDESLVYVKNRNGNPIGTALSTDLLRRFNLQHDIDKNLRFDKAIFFGTNNSYSTKRYPEVKRWVNQSNDVIAQLNAGFRTINFDLFQDRTQPDDNGTDVEVCHTWIQTSCEAGGRRLYKHLREIRHWIEDNPDEVIVIKIEDFMDDFHAAWGTAALIKNEDYLGKYHLPAKDAGSFRELTKEFVRSQGKNIVYVCTNCQEHHPDSDYTGEVFMLHPSNRFEKKGNSALYVDVSDTKWKYSMVYEDAVYDEFGANELTQTELYNRIHQRAYNMVSLDFAISRNDRFNAMLWSWTDGYPNSLEHNCAISDSQYQIFDQSHQWRSADCSSLVMPAACATPGDEGVQWIWDITAPTRFAYAHQACADMGMVFRTPQTPYENYWLWDAKKQTGVDEVMLNYAKQGWTDEDWKIVDADESLAPTNQVVTTLNVIF